jgi:hypothetical protein
MKMPWVVLLLDLTVKIEQGVRVASEALFGESDGIYAQSKEYCKQGERIAVWPISIPNLSES